MKSLLVRGGAVLAALTLTASITPAAMAAPVPTPSTPSGEGPPRSTQAPAAPRAADGRNDADPLSEGDEFDGPGLNAQWQVSVNTGKGKSIFRPENVTLREDGHLAIRSSRHCLPLNDAGEPTEESSESNRTDEVCPAGTRTAYTSGRIDTPFNLGAPRSMEVRAKIDGATAKDNGHYGITSTAWTHNQQPFCGENGEMESDMVEMDTMEIWKLGMSHNSTHLNCREGKGKNIGDRINKRIPGKWHVWRMEFDGYAIRYFLDGEVVLKEMPSKGLTAEVAGMSQEEFSHDVLTHKYKMSIYTTANANGGWAPFVDDAERFETQTDLWDYVRWEEFDPKAPGCAPAGEIATVAAATEGLGENWTCERDTEAMDARVQDFTGGRVYTTPQGGAVALTGPIWDKFNAVGGERALGAPTGQPRQVAGATVQDFTGGMLVSSAAGTHLVKGEIGAKWLTVADALGAPIGDELCGLAGGGCVQRFERETGHIYWSPSTGAHFTRGRIQAKYGDMGWENSNIGYPITDEICGIRDGGCFQRFQSENGHIYWSFRSDAHFVRGAIFSRYATMRWETGVFGYPITDERCGLRDRGCVQEFQGESGHIYWSPASGPWSVQGAIFSHYQRNAWERGRFGYPVGAEQCRDLPGARECVQGFQGGRITWNSRSGLFG